MENWTFPGIVDEKLMRSCEHRVFVVGRVIALVSGKGFVGFQDSEVDVTCQSIIIFTKQPHSYFLHSLICSFVISRPGGMGKASAVEGLVLSKLLKQHLKACKASLTKCGLCALHNAWKKYKKPWLRAKLVNDEIKLGCAICATDNLPGPWAAFEQEPANISEDCISTHVYVAGFPCPSFSNLGRRRGVVDRRGLCTLSGPEYIARTRPKVIVLEQVASILHKTHAKVWGFVLKILAALKYKVVFKILNTKNFAVPQSRPRVYLL